MTLSEFFKKKNAVKIGTPLKPMGEFPLIDAHDVIVEIAKDENGNDVEVRLDTKLKNVGNGNVVLDKSLTQDGQAADAKAVGDRIDQTLGDIHSILERI